MTTYWCPGAARSPIAGGPDERFVFRDDGGHVRGGTEMIPYRPQRQAANGE